MSKSIIENLKVLKHAVTIQPESNFNLGWFQRDNLCGTLYCTAGLACTIDHFTQQGMKIVKDGGLHIVEIDGVAIYDTNQTDVLFGENSYMNLFTERDGMESQDYNYPSVDEHLYVSDEVTDRELAIWRLQRQIEKYEAREAEPQA